MALALTTIGFDADDTLWQNEQFFAMTQDRFADLLADHADKPDLMARLMQAERRNLSHYGFGIKGFTLSMIETAIEITQGKVPATVIGEILDAGRDMLSHPVELLPGVQDTLAALRPDHKLLLITKGDLLDQMRKVEQSGLREHFDAIEIVSHKTPAEYTEIFRRHGTGADQGLMAGNSMSSDVLPMLEAGGWGVLIPHGLTWALEHAKAPQDHPRFAEIPDLAHLPALVAQCKSAG
ncbi:HAD family hydrolase [Sulfitobacter sp. G21635-S1]|uniref:HAD family hydrolase n=1 Tax=Sulfitobacter sp. G21635-S1 TaxID=3014043 RepID=UPI0022AF7F0E|nr:HAD family hydrolase [Sulfitobacter sp. G21635-S1]MCZ4256389.1 HAD family hydrolase [Sulfitobacter sp. G21635-S1]GLT11883.1 haloacid dehalogenase [Sulfitobacter porphyrae]